MNKLFTFILLLSSIFPLEAENFQSVSRESLLKELQETKADSGLLILLKDNEISAKVTLIQENEIYKDGNDEIFRMKRDMGTLLSPLYMLSVLDSISLTDTVDVGNGIYIKDGKEIRDHNADRGGYGVLTAKQVILFDSKVGMTKIMERYNEKELQYSPLEVVDFYNQIANKDTSLCSPKAMEDIRNMLSKVITEGTGKNLYREDIPIVGKTGKADNEVSCCVYFTLDEAVYTCLVIISNPKKGVPSGGTMCGNVIKEIVNEVSK